MNKNIKDIIKVFTIKNSGNFFSLFYLIVIGKTLSTDQFGLATALVAFVGLCGTIYEFLPSIISKHLSYFSKKNVKDFYYFNLRKYLLLIIFFGFLIFSSYYIIFSLLKFESFLLLALIIIMFILNGIVKYNDGIILGKQFFLYHSQANFILNFFRKITKLICI